MEASALVHASLAEKLRIPVRVPVLWTFTIDLLAIYCEPSV